ncbi:MAG: 6-phosphogluconolactonase [Acidobacteriota bacterium]
MSPMPSPPPLKRDPLRIEICKDPEDLARHAAGLFVGYAGRALGSRGRFRVALSGGRTPRRMYAALTLEHVISQIVWPAVQLFFSDERCVPPDDDRSNYRMAHEALLSKLPIPEENIHRMRGELEDPDAAARAYEEELRREFAPGEVALDLVMLGMGADGHTASLFPGEPASKETDRLVTAARPAGGPARLTLTFPAINAARAVMILVSGEGKAEIARRVLGAETRAEEVPIQSVRPADGEVVWLLDAAAASKLSPPDASNQARIPDPGN